MRTAPRFTYILFILFLVSSPFLITSTEVIAATRSLKEADACRDALKTRPERKKNRANWEQCIQKYKAVSSKQGKGRASYEIGRLYQELYLYSDQVEDLKEAKRYYEKALQASDKEAFADDARKQRDKLSARLDQTFGSRPLDPAKDQSKDQRTVVSNIRHWSYPDYTRVVIDLNQPPSYHVERPAGSSALSIHLSHAALGELFQQNRSLSVSEGDLQKIEIKQKEQNQIDVSLTFKNLRRYKIIPISDPDRLVIDVFNGEAPVKKGIDLEDQVNAPTPKVALPPPPSFDIRTIVIDPGHGGKDPGAIGSHGLTEKEVTLDVSLRLRELIQKRLKRGVIMTRDRDVFIPLDERTLLANAQKADLFISVHANASPKRNTQGIEIYLLGRATDEGALATAARENGASQKAALDFQEVILNDLERDFNLNESLEFAHLTQKSFIENLLPKYPTVALGVKRAPFYVLANTHMPAILAEISFISNPVEERRLQNGLYRQRVAEALLAGVERYLRSIRCGGPCG